MSTRFELLQGSVTGKVLFIGLLILVLLIPIGMIEGLIRERTHRFDTARVDIASSWGEAQTVGEPILAVPFQFTRMAYEQPITITDELYLLPEELQITANVEVQELKRGVYRVPVYTARLRVSGRFSPPTLGADYEDLQILWNQAQIALPLSDARPVKEPVVLRSGDASADFQSGGTRVAGFGPQLVARYADLGLGAQNAPQAFSIELAIGGTGSLQFAPLGDVTRVNLTSNWPSPSFMGAYLPDEREPTSDGFTAAWRVLALGRGYPQSWKRSAPPPLAVAESVFGVELITPVGIYEASLRAAKYAVLVIGLTFTAYFLFELLAAVRLHTLQYLLIGASNCVFYLLLLALAEQIGFGAAYALSAAASVALIGMYSGAVLGSMRRALPVSAMLAALYGYLYVTLQAEDYALLFGAAGSFAALTALMYLTRHIDWHTVSFDRRPGAADGAMGHVQLHA
jgi:inner membrane protein